MEKTDTFSSINFDIIIGSDLIYFEESIGAVVKMLHTLFAQNKTTTFYMC